MGRRRHVIDLPPTTRRKTNGELKTQFHEARGTHGSKLLHAPSADGVRNRKLIGGPENRRNRRTLMIWGNAIPDGAAQGEVTMQNPAAEFSVSPLQIP